MKRTLLVPAFLAFAFCTAQAQPSDQSLDELMRLTSMEKLTDSLIGQLEQDLRQTFNGATRGMALTQQQQKAFELAPSRVTQALRPELNWENLFKPMFLTVYRETFTQAEVDGMIEFYKTPAGKASIEKRIIVSQRTGQITRERMQYLTPKINAAIKQVLLEAGVPE